MKNALYMCDQCKGKFDFGSIRYTSDGKKLVCLGCHDQLKKAAQATEAKNPEIAEAAEPVSDIVKVICVKCRYKFSLKRQSRARFMCPYCSGNNIIRDDTTAERLLEEVSEELSRDKEIRENISQTRQKMSL